MDSYFHYPRGKSKEYKDLQKSTTNKYGNLTTTVFLVLILLIPVLNTLVKYGYYYHSRSKIVGWLHHRFSSRSRLGHLINSVLHSTYYHLSTIIQLTIWMIIFSSLSLSELYNGDLIFLAQRTGTIAANCLTPILFLTIRPSPLPNTLYLSLIPIHKWLSRFIILESVIHTVLYFGYMIKQGTPAKAYKLENLYGWLALGCFFVIFITSLSKMKNRFFKLFYACHYVLTWVIVGALQYHVRPNKLDHYTMFNVGIMVFQIINRIRMTKVSTDTEVVIHDVSPNLLLVEFPNHLIHKKSLFPASHIRLSKRTYNLFWDVMNQIIPNYHPYTLVSLPNDLRQKLLIRKGKFQFTETSYLFTGSYDPNLLFISQKKTPNRSINESFNISKLNIDTKRVLIVVGGSAISFALPILRCMNYHGLPIKIVWVIKDFRDIALLKYFDGYIHGDDFEIFVTGSDVIDDITHYGTFDLESNGVNNSLGHKQSTVSNWEDEDVDIAAFDDEDEEEDENCYKDTNPLDFVPREDLDLSDEDDWVEGPSNTYSTSQFEEATGDSVSVHSLKTNTSSSTNDHFLPQIKSMNDLSRDYLNNYKNTIKRLNISNKIYKGRPQLNHRYHNWCLHDGFTQCTGPVEMGSNLVCCKDLPQNNVSETDSSKVWVLSAGPKGLVNNVKVWCQENGLKFHEEAFYS